MRSLKRLLSVVAVVSSLLVFPLATTSAQESAGHMNHAGGMNHQAHEDHSMHMKMMQNRNFKLSSKQYTIPDVTLIDADGKKTSMAELLSADGPVALNFIFTTCTTICPVMTATFASMQRVLDREQLDRLRLISISIDPEYDRPAVLRSYADRFKASKSWLFLTGRSQDINAVMRAFDAYAGSKMNHQPLTFLRKQPLQPWLRVDGLASGKDLANLAVQNLF
ncbi:MAG: SCO family protein [Gammaproteobacteria bacterium]